MVNCAGFVVEAGTAWELPEGLLEVDEALAAVTVPPGDKGEPMKDDEVRVSGVC